MQKFLKQYWEFVTMILILLGGIGFLEKYSTVDYVDKANAAVEIRLESKVAELKSDTNRHLETIQRDVKTILRTMPRRSRDEGPGE